MQGLQFIQPYSRSRCENLKLPLGQLGIYSFHLACWFITTDTLYMKLKTTILNYEMGKIYLLLRLLKSPNQVDNKLNNNIQFKHSTLNLDAQ